MKNLDLEMLIKEHVDVVKQNEVSLAEALELAEAERLKEQCTLEEGINFIKVTKVIFKEDSVTINFINTSCIEAGEQVLYKETFSVAENIFDIQYLKDDVAEALNLNGFGDLVAAERERVYKLAGVVNRAKGTPFSDAYKDLLNGKDFPRFDEVGVFTPNAIIPVWGYINEAGYWRNCFKPAKVAKKYCEERGWVLKQPQQVEYLKSLTAAAIAQING